MSVSLFRCRRLSPKLLNRLQNVFTNLAIELYFISLICLPQFHSPKTLHNRIPKTIAGQWYSVVISVCFRLLSDNTQFLPTHCIDDMFMQAVVSECVRAPFEPQLASHCSLNVSIENLSMFVFVPCSTNIQFKFINFENQLNPYHSHSLIERHSDYSSRCATFDPKVN